MIDLSDKQIKELLEILESEERFFTVQELAKRLTVKFILPPTLDALSSIESVQVRHETLSESNKKIERLYCHKIFFDELISEITFEGLVQFKIPKSLVDLRAYVRFKLATFLGLNQTELDLMDAMKLENILSADDRFKISHKSSFEIGKNNLVALKSWEEKLYKPKRFVLDVIDILALNNGISLKKLLLKLNLSNNDYGFVKPYTIDTFKKVMQFEGNIFEIDEDTIRILSINDRVELALLQKKRLSNFKVNEQVSGLLIFLFIGDEFPIKEANEYVSLRPIVYFFPVFNIALGMSKLIESFKKSLQKMFGRNFEDIDEWVNENLAISFVIENFDYLKLNFDGIMKEYSPVLNLEKNPGNLFRSIIEEKIREYESGKES